MNLMKVQQLKRNAPSVETRKCNIIPYNFDQQMKVQRCFTHAPIVATDLEQTINHYVYIEQIMNQRSILQLRIPTRWNFHTRTYLKQQWLNL